MSRIALARLKKEFEHLKKDPVPFVTASPLSSNLLEWHYVIQGPPNTPFSGGLYHGKVKFPPEYPNKPPSILMLTPNGRFAVNTRICLSMSDFHPETWNPLWSVASILSGLLSFMLESTASSGCVVTTDAEKQAYAARSWEYNTTGPNKAIYLELFAQVQPAAPLQVSAASLPVAQVPLHADWKSVVLLAAIALFLSVLIFRV
eukprot:c7508_g1_i2.p1 GENE.c7508_g1_i2~~c7508_g1_i2.p1  ORF type:complete len:203 (+),score=30.72 c7508_g1_i2:821-1429(+)